MKFEPGPALAWEVSPNLLSSACDIAFACIMANVSFVLSKVVDIQSLPQPQAPIQELVASGTKHKPIDITGDEDAVDAQGNNSGYIACRCLRTLPRCLPACPTGWILETGCPYHIACPLMCVFSMPIRHGRVTTVQEDQIWRPSSPASVRRSAVCSGARSSSQRLLFH